MVWAREFDVALQAIVAAGAEVMRLYATLAKVDNPPAEISTEADKNSQEIILHQLHNAFPADRLCGEEETALLKAAPAEAPRCWIIDPIDGTRGYAEKLGEFSIMIGLVDRDHVVMGLVLESAKNRLTYAVRGQGCFVADGAGGDPKRCQVSKTPILAGAVLSASRSQKADGQRKLLDGFGATRLDLTYSAGVKLAQVARGETDMYLGDYLTLKDWDVCAGHILVEEAGGRVTSVDGTPITYDGTGKSLKGRGILSSNGLVHEAALEVIRTGKYVCK